MLSAERDLLRESRLQSKHPYRGSVAGAGIPRSARNDNVDQGECRTPQTREWDAAAYHRLSGPQVSWGKKVLSGLKLCGNELLMDAGCGTGRLTAELLQDLPHGRVVGVDLSQNMLVTARDHLIPQFGLRVHFVVADLQNLPFEHSFDGIFSTAALHWVPDHLRLFGSLFRALRPGGWLRAQCGGGPKPDPLKNAHGRAHGCAEICTVLCVFSRSLGVQRCGDGG